MASIDDGIKQKKETTCDDTGYMMQSRTEICSCGQNDEKESEVEKAKRRRRNRSPLFFCKFIVKYPEVAFGITLSLHLFMAALNFILMAAGIDMFPAVFNTVPLNLKTDQTRLREWAWTYRDSKDALKIPRYSRNATGPTWPRGLRWDPWDVYYVHNGKNVFTSLNLKRMSRIENGIYKLPRYQNEFCKLDASSYCIKPRSILRFFDGTFNETDTIFFDPEFKNVQNVLWEASQNPLTAGEFRFFLSRESHVKRGDVSTAATRTAVHFGWPLEGPGTTREKRERVKMFLVNTVAPKMEELKRKFAGDLEVSYLSIGYFFHQAPIGALGNLMFAIGSICFVYLFMWSQTKSLWITSFAIMSIVTCFFITNFIYRIILDYRYFGYFHLISVFIILGIGADDIFVFFNTWKASEHQEYPSLAHRMSDCYRRASATMFFTSLTTAVAFVSSGFSPLLAIETFGVFSAILVAVNYISVIMFFPTVVVMYHKYFESKSLCMCCCSKDRKVAADDTVSINLAYPKNQNPIVIFFRDYYFRFVTHKIIRWIIIMFFLGLIGFSIWAVTLLRPETAQVRVFKLNTNLGKAWELSWNGFKPSDQSDFISVNLVWGLKERDLSTCHFSIHTCRGRTVWDNTFNMNLPPAQQALKDFCHKLKHGLTPQQVYDLRIANDSFTGERKVECFIDDLEEYMKNEGERINKEKNTSLDLSLPFSPIEMRNFMNINDPKIYNVSSLPRTFYRYLEVGVAYWLTNRYSFYVTPDYIKYNKRVGEAYDEPYSRIINNPSPERVGIYGTKLRYIGLRVNLTISPLGLPYYEGIPIMNNWENFMNKELAKMPLELRGGFQTTYLWWHWMKVQENLVIGAVRGILIGIGLAIPVLILATMNIIVGLFASLNLCFITVSVIGIIPLAGWKLGILTSVNMSLVVGLSVDYVVHLAEGYHLSEHKDRKGRVKDMLEALGVSVVCGAFTTIGSSFFLFFGQIQFFLQFGVFMFSVIGFSMIYSLGLFTTAMAIIGPENEIGSLYPIFRGIRNLIKGRKKSDQECEHCNGSGFIKLNTSFEKDNKLNDMSEGTKFNDKHINGDVPKQDLVVMTTEPNTSQISNESLTSKL